MIRILAAAALTAADLYIKARFRKMPEGAKKEICGGRIELRPVYNRGLLGSRFSGDQKTVRRASIAGAALLTACICEAFLSRKGGPAEKTGLAILAAGAAGNLAERFRHLLVAHFLDGRLELFSEFGGAREEPAVCEVHDGPEFHEAILDGSAAHRDFHGGAHAAQ